MPKDLEIISDERGVRIAREEGDLTLSHGVRRRAQADRPECLYSMASVRYSTCHARRMKPIS